MTRVRSAEYESGCSASIRKSLAIRPSFVSTWLTKKFIYQAYRYRYTYTEHSGKRSASVLKRCDLWESNMVIDGCLAAASGAAGGSFSKNSMRDRGWVQNHSHDVHFFATVQPTVTHDRVLHRRLRWFLWCVSRVEMHVRFITYYLQVCTTSALSAKLLSCCTWINMINWAFKQGLPQQKQQYVQQI